MYKYSLLLLGTLSLLQADFSGFTLEEQASSKAEYFVKIGAFSKSEATHKMVTESEGISQVLFLGKYHSVVSESYDTKEEAQKKLASLKERYHDAYIITLYKKELKKEVVVPAKVEVAELVPTEYQKAVAYYDAKSYEEALAGFDRVLIDDENNLDAQIYYAKTLYQLGIYEEARKVLKTLLSSDLNKQQKIQIEKILEAVEQKTKRHFFTTTLALGMGYDDNINLTTDASTTKYAGLTLLNDTNKSNSYYGSATLSLTHRYDGDNFDIVSSLYSYNELAHSHEGNDLNFLNLSTGVLKSINNWSFMLPVGINGAYLDGDAVAYNIYTNPTISYDITKHIKSYVQGSYLDNTTKFVSGRDYTMLGVNVGTTYTQSKFRVGAQVGMADINQKENVRFDVEKDVLSAALFGKYMLFTKSFIAANVAMKQDKYVVLDKAMGYKREDDTLTMGLSLGQNIGKNSLVEVKYLHRNNDSNINAYAYDKNIYTVQYKYKF